jgi:hypothetical protein
MTLKSQHAATLQLPEDDPYYPWEVRFLDKPDTMARYMRAAKWYIFCSLDVSQKARYSLLLKEIRRREKPNREVHRVEARI